MCTVLLLGEKQHSVNIYIGREEFGSIKDKVQADCGWGVGVSGLQLYLRVWLGVGNVFTYYLHGVKEIVESNGNFFEAKGQIFYSDHPEVWTLEDSELGSWATGSVWSWPCGWGGVSGWSWGSLSWPSLQVLALRPGLKGWARKHLVSPRDRVFSPSGPAGLSVNIFLSFFPPYKLYFYFLLIIIGIQLLYRVVLAQSGSAVCVPTSPLFQISFPFRAVEFPVLYIRVTLIVCFKHSGIYMSTPITMFISLPFSSLVFICSFSTSCVSISALQISSSVSFF